MSSKREPNWTVPAEKASSDSALKSPSKAFVDAIKERMSVLFPGEAQFVTANRFGINPSYLSNILNLRVPPPSLEKVFSIAEVLQIDPMRLASLAGYVFGRHAFYKPRHKSEGHELSRALTPVLSSEMSVSLDDMMAMILGKYVEIRETDGVEALIDFIDSEMVPGLSSRQNWMGKEGTILRTYRGIGEGILAVISAMEKAKRHMENLPRARSDGSLNPDFRFVDQDESKSCREKTELGKMTHNEDQKPEPSKPSTNGKASRIRRNR